MPINTDALKDSLNGQKPKPKRPQPNPEQQREQLQQADQTTAGAINALAQAGVNSINAQVFAFDCKLTRYERDMAQAMADRLRQSPLRIQQYLMEELATQNTAGSDFAEMIDDALEVPDLTSDFLTILPSSVAGCLPI